MFISGSVQGVTFRSFIKQKAEELELKGYVRNLSDGKVEIGIEGKDENVNQLVELCKKGPPHADVRNVEVQEMSHQGFKDFKISFL
jgi:acylphosphatase